MAYAPLPAYQVPQNALLDFAPLNQGIATFKQDRERVRRQEVAQQAGNALMGGDYKTAMGTALAGDRADLAGLALQAKGQASSEASAALDREHKLAQMYGGAAQRVLETKDPKLWGAILNSHPEMGNKLRRAGIDPNDHMGGAQFLMAQAQGYRDPLDAKLKNAQIANLYASAEARKALANYRDGKAPVAEQPSPAAGWGMDEEGNLVPPRGPAINPGNTAMPPASVPADVAPRVDIPPVGVGRFAPSSMQVADKPTSRGDAIGRYATDEDRQRLLRDMQKRQALEATYGKPPSGMRWNDSGGLEDLKLKNTATERASRMAAENGIKALENAERILSRKGTTEQLFGDTYNLPGGVKVGGFGEAGRGFRAAESAVLQLNFALSGKSVSNAEREHFMRVYMPSAMDSRETQAWKLGQVKQFFQVIQNARRSGMDDDRIAELYRQKLAEGTAGPQEKIDPAKQRLMNKYGLE